MADDSNIAKQEERLESEVREMHLKEEDRDVDDANMDTVPEAGLKKERSMSVLANDDAHEDIMKASRSPAKSQSVAQSPASKSEQEDMVGGEVTLKQEPGKPPKLARSTSHKIEKRPPPMFNDYKDSTADATSTFQVITECTYANKSLGSTDPALECDCAEEWGKSSFDNFKFYRVHGEY